MIRSILALVKPVRQKLQTFNHDANYDREGIKLTLRRLVQSGRVDGVVLQPDQNSFTPLAATSSECKLLVSLCCEQYVDLIVNPRFGKRGRIPRQQMEFASKLKSDIHSLENGEAMSNIWP